MRHRLAPHRPRRARRTLVLATTLAVVAAGCADTADEGRASGPADASAAATSTGAPVTSGGATNAVPATATIAVVPGWEAIAEPILAGVADSAGVSFELDLDWMDANAGEDVEQRLLGAVAAGELDAALVGARALSTAGVAGFDVLVAPWLVDSYALQETILASDIPERLLAGLDAIGVVGVALVPGPMRYPIGVDGPFVARDDFDGATFHTFPGEQNAATAVALGATHSQLWGDERNAAIDDGTIDVTENSMEWMRNNGRGSHITLDPLWPAIGVFIVNPDAAATWSTSRLSQISDAIAAASATADELVEADTALLAELCAAGKQAVRSTEGERSALLGAVQPVYERLAVDAAAGPLLDDIRALASTLAEAQPAVPTECDGSAAGSSAQGTDDPSVLDGTYQLVWTVEELMALPDVDEGTARGNAGGFTLVLDDGGFEMRWERFPGDRCDGTYGVSGDRVQFVAARDLARWTCGGETLGVMIMDAAWRLEGDQLVLSDFVVTDDDITSWNAGYFSKPLTRAG